MAVTVRELERALARAIVGEHGPTLDSVKVSGDAHGNQIATIFLRSTGEEALTPVLNLTQIAEIMESELS